MLLHWLGSSLVQAAQVDPASDAVRLQMHGTQVSLQAVPGLVDLLVQQAAHFSNRN